MTQLNLLHTNKKNLAKNSNKKQTKLITNYGLKISTFKSLKEQRIFASYSCFFIQNFWQHYFHNSDLNNFGQ